MKKRRIIDVCLIVVIILVIAGTIWAIQNMESKEYLYYIPQTGMGRNVYQYFNHLWIKGFQIERIAEVGEQGMFYCQTSFNVFIWDGHGRVVKMFQLRFDKDSISNISIADCIKSMR